MDSHFCPPLYLKQNLDDLEFQLSWGRRVVFREGVEVV